MPRRTLNLGILAHVDAGKTTLTERLLHAAGLIDQLGSVDRGTTQTDTLALERQRGITIKSAVASFPVDGVTVNLIDTPGHPDFIAEVERALAVLDGAVLVLSAVEGVQAQTIVLMRALQRLRVPTLLFVNKIDRSGADSRRVLRAISDRLTAGAVAMGTARAEGEREAAFLPGDAGDVAFLDDLALALGEHDARLLATYAEDPAAAPYPALRRALAAQVARARVYPVFLGSAATGAGVPELTAGVAELLPAAAGDPSGALSGAVFKIARDVRGVRVAYVRLFSGTVRTRDHVRVGDAEHTVTGIAVFEGGTALPAHEVGPGGIAVLSGLASARVGDAVGVRRPGSPHRFARLTLETVVEPCPAGDARRLHAALTELADQDPLIAVRRHDRRQELSVSLYGEVQKEVVQATLADEFGVEARFRETTPILVERLVGTGAAVERLGDPLNPFPAGVGLRVSPGAAASGVRVRIETPVESLPLFVFRAVEHFRAALEDTVRRTLDQGLRGWPVVDCDVTLTECWYSAPATAPKHYRLLTPLVLMRALRQAGTVVCEPLHRFRLEVPADSVAAACALLARIGATPGAPTPRGSVVVLEGTVPAARLHELQRDLLAATRGEGVAEAVFERYAPVSGAAPTRPRWDDNPLDRREYLLRVTRRRLERGAARVAP